MKFKTLYIFLIILLFSCVTTPSSSDKDENSTMGEVQTSPSDPENQPTKKELNRIKIDNIIESMTLEEKIGQLFIFHIRGFKKMNQELEDFIKQYKPGGVILFSNNIENNEQVKELNQQLQNSSSIPMFISVDEEGGLVSRLGKEKNVDVTHLPPALTIGSRENPTLAYNSGKILGRELSALGFNMDMAPIADVNTNPENPVIGNRTYSADPHIAGEMVINVIKGFKEENMVAVIKHFPGHGDTKTDSHVGTVISPHNRERLEQIEFVPFKMGIESGVDVIMTAHMNMPGITTTPLPATLNPQIITDILRSDMGFNGIIMTDALDMGAIINNFSSGEAAILGLKAGIDILLIPHNPKNAFNAILESVRSNRIAESRIDQSVERILTLKQKYGILDNNIAIESILDVQNDPKHRLLIDSIFKKQ